MIGGRYEPIEQIGTGGMATVWRARDTHLARIVAIKRLLPHLASDPKAAERFTREARAAAGLSHPGIVTVFDSGVDGQGPFIVLELVDGISLAEHLANVGPIDPVNVIDIVSQVASALDHAHAQGVVHRDIKPGNVILDEEGRARLADFGIARTVEDTTTITASGELIGTIAYMAPEILAGAPASPSSDIYSLGAVTYELLAGRPPYSAATPAALLEAVRSAPAPSLSGIAPDRMASAVSAAMAKAPDDRPGTAGELASAMTDSVTLVMGLVPPAEPVSPTSPSGDPTVVTTAPTSPARPEENPTGGRWKIPAALLAVVVTAAAAIAADRGSGRSPDSSLPLAAATTTTTASPATTTTNPPTTSTSLTTTTTTAITTTTPPHTPETVSAEIRSLLAALGPPVEKPKEIRQIGDRLDRAMELWRDDQREDLARELERAFEEVDDLGQTPEREVLRDRFIELAELMGFEVTDGGGGDQGEED